MQHLEKLPILPSDLRKTKATFRFQNLLYAIDEKSNHGPRTLLTLKCLIDSAGGTQAIRCKSNPRSKVWRDFLGTIVTSMDYRSSRFGYPPLSAF